MNFEMIRIPQPFYKPTNVIRIGNVIFDTGHMSNVSTSVLREQMERKLRNVKEVVVTHPHVDHIGGSATLPDLAEKPHIVFSGGEKILRNFSNYLRDVRKEQYDLFKLSEELMQQYLQQYLDTYFPLVKTYIEVNVARLVEDGEQIRAGDVLLRVVYTPGHEAHHIALHHEQSRTIFTGDLVMGNAIFPYAPLTSDVGSYENSLRKIIELKPRLIIPSHGEPIENPVEHAEKCLRMVKEIESKILRELEVVETATHLQLAESIFGSKDLTKLVFLSLVVLAHSKHLEEKGKVEVKGTVICKLD